VIHVNILRNAQFVAGFLGSCFLGISLQYLVRFRKIENIRGYMMNENEPWVPLEDIALHLGVSQDTVHRWIRSREMPAHKVGRLWKFQISEVNEWVRAGKAGGRDE